MNTWLLAAVQLTSLVETGGYRIDDIFIDLVPPREDYYMVELNQTLSKEDTECWFDMRRDIKDEWGKGDSFASLPFGVWAVSKGEKTRGETTLEPTSTPVETTRTSGAAEATTTANDPAAQTTTGSTGEPTETNNESNDEGLSTGAQTGIGVGVSIGGLGLIAAGVAFWLLRRRRAKPDGDETAINKNDDDSSRAEGGFVEPKAELDADSQRAELSGDRQAAELDSPEVVKELAGTVTLAEMDSPQTVTELSSPDTAGTVSPESPAYKKPFGAPVELPA